jgi:CheY-like chemotaxis protein
VEINQEIFIALLEDTHVHIDTAKNGAEAVAKFTGNPDLYDLIIMDIQMPEMDGYEATRRLREFERTHPPDKTHADAKDRPIPIIAMTANVFKEDVNKCLENGMNGHLAKPIDLDAVLAAITSQIKKS